MHRSRGARRISEAGAWAAVVLFAGCAITGEIAELGCPASFADCDHNGVNGCEVDIAGDRYAAGRLLIFRPGDRITVTAVGDAHLVLLGGATMDGPRHIWWNFVSSRKERIDADKEDWKAGRFDLVPGDAKEFIPLPD